MSSKIYTEDKPLSERLMAARVDIGLTFEEAAAQIGCSASHISHVEKGKRKPSKYFAKQVEEWLQRIGSRYRISVEPAAATRQVPQLKKIRGGPSLGAIDLVIERLERSPDSAPWVLALLRILESNEWGAMVGIQESLRAFIGTIGEPGISIPAKLPKRTRKKSLG